MFFSNIYKVALSNRRGLFSTNIVERVYYVAKEYKMSNFLDKDIEFSSDESDEGVSDKEYIKTNQIISKQFIVNLFKIRNV